MTLTTQPLLPWILGLQAYTLPLPQSSYLNLLYRVSEAADFSVRPLSYSHFSLLHFKCQRSMKFRKLTPRGRGLGCATAPLLDFHCVHHPAQPLPWDLPGLSACNYSRLSPSTMTVSLFKSRSFKRSSVLLRVASSLLNLDSLTLSPLYLIQISFSPLSSNLMLWKGIFLDLQILPFST